MTQEMDEAQVKRLLKQRIRTEGVLAGFDAMLDVLRNPKAPAPAKATMVSTMFRAAGYLKDDADNGDATDLRELPADIWAKVAPILEAELAQTEKSVARLRSARVAQEDEPDQDDDGDIFA